MNIFMRHAAEGIFQKQRTSQMSSSINIGITILLFINVNKIGFKK